MGTLYEAVCKDCGHEFELLTGWTMTASQKVCESCGNTVMVPSRAPAGSFELSKRGLE
ncbi:MAG: zinc ribbon domain-containing protein [Gallionella sp.]|nr:zinc ribbon domain-containing protein [Gallionella sp.]